MSSSILPSLQTNFVRYGMSLILIFGNIGNLLIVILFSRRRESSCSKYLLCAAVMNSAVMISNLPLSIYSLDHKDPTVNILALCKIRYYIAHAWGQIARYLTVLACVDRFVLTSNNARFRPINRPSVARYIIGITIIFWHIFPIHIPILTTVNGGVCAPSGIYYFVYFVYLVIFFGIIPPVSMGVFGFLAYRNMNRLHARVRPIRNATDGNRHDIIIHRRDRELFSMVLAEVIVYILTTFTYPFIILEVTMTNYMGINKTIERIQIESFFSSMGGILVFSNSAIPFYIYLVASKPFRKDFIELFVKRRRPAIRQDNIPAQNTARN